MLRLKAGLEQKVLAEALNLSQATVSRIEHGQSLPSAACADNWLACCSGSPRCMEAVAILLAAGECDAQLRALSILEDELTALLRVPAEPHALLPYFADVAAGLGEAQERRVEPRRYIEVPAAILRRDPGCYALRVSGDSMIPRLADGDIVVVSPAAALVEGCIVAAYIEPDGDVVKVYRELPGGTVLLTPLNPDYPAVLLGGEGREGRIWGRIVMLTREL